MDDLKNLVKSSEMKLASEDDNVLREEVLRLEEESKAQIKGFNPDQLNRKLWTHLVELSVQLQNVQLSILAVAKLKLAQLALLLHATINQKTSSEEKRKILALYYVANYFNIELPSEIQKRLGGLTRSPEEQDDLVDLFINAGKWDVAIDSIATSSTTSPRSEFKINSILHRLAIYSELDEKYSDALDYYEKSGARKENSIRTILKQHTNLAFGKLKSYCLSSDGCLRNFWFDFLLASGAHLNANEQHELRSDSRMLITGNLKHLERITLDGLPENLRLFAKDVNPSRWNDKRQMDHVVSNGASLDSVARKQLANLALRYQETNSFHKACNILLCLEQFESLFSFLPKSTDQISLLKLVHRYGRQDQLAASLRNFSRNSLAHSEKNEAQKAKESSLLFVSYLKLGLINEALITLTSRYAEDETALLEGIEHLEGIVDKRLTVSMSDIDPIIERRVLKDLFKIGKRQIYQTHVITIVILAIIIFLSKIENIGYSSECIVKLEIMFKLASEHFVCSDFVASDSLIRSISTLVDTIKEILDLLADCDIIKDSFRQMVEATADRCMIESRYKSAAMLYNHIEDHKSAVKSLMRMGDLDVVINYSLLVRDVAVNRITINYLRHLSVDPAIIKDFISRSQI